MSSLTPDQVALQLDNLAGWTLDGQSIIKTYQFADFPSVISFITLVAFHAQELEHFPHWQNYYNELFVRIGSVEKGTLHSRDIQLAKRLETVFANFHS